jgi:hypothetical protein
MVARVPGRGWVSSLRGRTNIPHLTASPASPIDAIDGLSFTSFIHDRDEVCCISKVKVIVATRSLLIRFQRDPLVRFNFFLLFLHFRTGLGL